jgi:hypothetical protein
MRKLLPVGPLLRVGSLQSLSHDIIISRATKLGVSLGSSSTMVSNLIKNIKDNDNIRTIIMLSKNLEEKIRRRF